VPLHPCVPGSPTAASRGPKTQVRHAAPPWGAPIVDPHDCVLPRDMHCIASIRVFIEFHTPNEGPRDHKILHHVVVLELVLNGVCVVWAGLLKESLEVVCRRSCLVLATACGNRDVPHAKAACFLVVATIIAVCGRNPLRTFLAPLLAALGIMDGDVEWHLLAAARGSPPCYLGQGDVRLSHCWWRTGWRRCASHRWCS
jgi:hypothetical protein